MGLQGCTVGCIVSIQFRFGYRNHIDAAVGQNALVVIQHLGIAAVGNCQQRCALACQELAALSRGGVHTETVHQGIGNLIPVHGCLYIVGQIIVQLHKVVAALHGQGLEFIVVKFQNIVLIVGTQSRVQTGDRTGVFPHLHINTIGDALTLVVGLDQLLVSILHLGSDIGSRIVNNRSLTGFCRCFLTTAASGKTDGHNQCKQKCSNFFHCFHHIVLLMLCI